MLAVAIGLGGCATASEPTTGDDAGIVDDEDSQDGDGGDAQDEADTDDAGAGDAAPTEEPTGDTQAGAPGSGTATVQVDGQTYAFRVIQCLRDVPGLAGGTVAFQLDGVPPDTATELLEPLMGPVDPDADIRERLAPVLEGGPILSVSRVTDGGELVAVSTSLDEAYVTTADVSSAEARFLEISDAAAGATVQGQADAMTPEGNTAQMSIDAVCP